jgi:hypothetical protein
MLGTVFTNMSLGKVAVSFTHTIKASEPFFTVVLSALFLGKVPNTEILAGSVGFHRQTNRGGEMSCDLAHTICLVCRSLPRRFSAPSCPSSAVSPWRP